MGKTYAFRDNVKAVKATAADLLNPFLDAPFTPPPWDTENLSRLVEDNLLPDLQLWRQSGKLSVTAIHALIASANGGFGSDTDTRRWVEIRNNVIRFPRLPAPRDKACDRGCNWHTAAVLASWNMAIRQHGILLPNVTFLWCVPLLNRRARIETRAGGPAAPCDTIFCAHAHVAGTRATRPSARPTPFQSTCSAPHR